MPEKRNGQSPDPTAAARMQRYRARLRGEAIPRKPSGRPAKRQLPTGESLDAGLDADKVVEELKQILRDLDET
jgi:hypothetical protein